MCYSPSSSRNGICLQVSVNALLIGKVFDFMFNVWSSFLVRDDHRFRNKFCPRSHMHVSAVLILILLSSSYLNSVRKNGRHACNVIGLQFSFCHHFELWSSRNNRALSLGFTLLTFRCLSVCLLVDIVSSRPGFKTFPVPSWMELVFSKFALCFVIWLFITMDTNTCNLVCFVPFRFSSRSYRLFR